MPKFNNSKIGILTVIKDIRIFLFIVILTVPFFDSIVIKFCCLAIALMFQGVILLNKKRRHFYYIETNIDSIIFKYYRVGFKNCLKISKEDLSIIREIDSYIGNNFCETIKFFSKDTYIGEIRSQTAYKFVINGFKYEKGNELRGDFNGWSDEELNYIYSHLVDWGAICINKIEKSNEELL